MDMLTLDNGLRVIFNEDKSLKSVNLSIWAASGSRFETPETNGISHFIEHMLFKGTTHRSAFQIANEADEIGAQMNAYTTKEYTCFYIKALGRHIDKAADILFDMLTCPLFDKNDLEIERGVILEEIAMCEDDPSDVCFGLLEKTVMPKETLSFEILGSKKTVSGFTPNDLRQHMARFYVPERLVIGVSGCFSRDGIIDKINSAFGNKKNTGFTAEYKPVKLSTGITVKRRSFEQSQLMLAFPAVGSDSPERFPLQVLSSMLGSSSSSRLNQRIREQLGLVYSIDTWQTQAIGIGFLGVSMALTPKSESKALSETCGILRDFASTLKLSELSVAKEKVTSGLIMSREMPHSRLSANGYAQITRGTFVDDDEIIESINSLTLEKAQTLADRIIRPEKLSFAATGKIKKAEFYEEIINSTIK